MKGPCLVLAGPGSGKTSVIIRRIQNLIKNGADPESILAVTFSRASAEEMRLRFFSDIKASARSPQFGTFHSVFLKILTAGLSPWFKEVLSGHSAGCAYSTLKTADRTCAAVLPSLSGAFL